MVSFVHFLKLLDSNESLSLCFAVCLFVCVYVSRSNVPVWSWLAVLSVCGLPTLVCRSAIRLGSIVLGHISPETNIEKLQLQRPGIVLQWPLPLFLLSVVLLLLVGKGFLCCFALFCWYAAHNLPLISYGSLLPGISQWHFTYQTHTDTQSQTTLAIRL